MGLLPHRPLRGGLPPTNGRRYGGEGKTRDLIRHPPRGGSADATFPVRGEGFGGDWGGALIGRGGEKCATSPPSRRSREIAPRHLPLHRGGFSFRHCSFSLLYSLFLPAGSGPSQSLRDSSPRRGESQVRRDGNQRRGPDNSPCRQLPSGRRQLPHPLAQGKSGETDCRVGGASSQ